MSVKVNVGQRVEFDLRGHTYALVVLDEASMGPDDPTLLVFRDEGDDDAPLLTMHLNPEASCKEHLVAPPFEVTA